MIVISIIEHAFDVSTALWQFEKDACGSGAIVTFSGYVREESSGGKVEGLHLQAFAPMTETGIRDAVASARQRWNLRSVHVIHRVGDIQPGEAIVFVAAAAAHRRCAFEAADFLMDYLKTEAVFWKKEVTAEGAIWIEPRAEDHRDRKRWDLDTEL